MVMVYVIITMNITSVLGALAPPAAYLEKISCDGGPDERGLPDAGGRQPLFRHTPSSVPFFDAGYIVESETIALYI